MSNYDVALVVDAGTLSTGMTQLFANPQARQTLFKGTQTIGQAGVTTVDWSIDAAPQFVLAPPTQVQWDDKNTFSPTGNPKPSAPSDQMFQVDVPSLTTTIHLQQGDPVALTLQMTVFAQVGIAANQIVLASVAVLPINVQPLQELYLQMVCGLVYSKVADLLQGYKIPSVIEVEGLSFGTPVMTVGGGQLVVASNLTSSAAIDIGGVSWPQQPLGVLAGRGLLGALVTKYSNAIVQQMDSTTKNYSDSNWAGSYSVTGGISGASIALASTLPNVQITATFAATASVGVSWWLVPAACALEAASNIL